MPTLLLGVAFGLCWLAVRLVWRGLGWASQIAAIILWCLAVAVGIYAVRSFTTNHSLDTPVSAPEPSSLTYSAGNDEPGALADAAGSRRAVV